MLLLHHGCGDDAPFRRSVCTIHAAEGHRFRRRIHHIRLPSRERQIVIASYLDVIEKKIQLAEKQLNLMQLIKIGLMQQLFI